MNKRRTIAMFLGLLLITATIFNGCSTTKKSTQESKEAETEDNATSSTENTAADEPETLDIFINETWYPIDSFTGIIPETIIAETGVTLNVTVATDSNQLGVMLASGDLPDLVFTDTELDRLSDSSLCYSFNDLEKDYGASFNDVSDEAKNIAKSFSKDDNYYAILNNYNTKEEWSELKVGAPGQACIYYRKDLMEGLGNPNISNLDEFEKVLEQCKTTYPEMVPLGLGGYWKFQPIENWMGVSQSQFDGTTYYYEASAPEYKNYLKSINLYANKGLVTAEAYANENEADGHQLAYNNGCIFYSWYLSYSNLNQLQTESKKVNPNAEWGILPSIGESPIGTNRGWCGTFVSKKCKNPTAAAKLLTYMYSTEGTRTSMWGREGIDYTVDDAGVPTFSDEYTTSRSDGTMAEKYNTFFYFGSTAIQELYMNYVGLDADVLNQFSSYSKDYKNYPEISIAQPTSSSDAGIIKAKLDELKNYEGKVIFAATDNEFDTYYNEYMDALTKTGVQTYNDYMTKTIKEVKDKFGF